MARSNGHRGWEAGRPGGWQAGKPAGENIRKPGSQQPNEFSKNYPLVTFGIKLPHLTGNEIVVQKFRY